MSGDILELEFDQIPGVPSPQQRVDLIGHNKLYDALVQQIQQDRLSGGILLHGPRGVGKATLSFALARALLVTTGDEPMKRVAEQISAGVHPNISVLRRQPREKQGFYAAIRVEDVRRMRSSLHQTRGRAGFRVCIVDSIDDCNPSAANALLKTLEEPPEQTIFVLISHRPGSLLPTIRSRCHAHALRPLADEDLSRFLTLEAGLEGAHLSIVALAGGRPRRAFELLALGDAKILADLRAWLDLPYQSENGVRLALADQIASASEIEKALAREVITDYLAQEARRAAETGQEGRIYLASLTELWDNTLDRFADANTFNLDARQTLVTVLDSIQRHKLRTPLV